MNSTETLKQNLAGTILLPGNPGYDEARSIWNGMIDRRPAIIVRCRTEADVARAVEYARDNHLLVSIRGGGHNIAGHAVCDGGLMIDLSTMKEVRVDASASRVRVQPGATLFDVDRATQAHGLATPTGINSTTGIAGLALGGGFGWLSRKVGLTSDNLVSARMVTAEAECIQASATSHPDLYWALRGGGGNFGVVTEFEFALHPIGPEVFSGLVVFPRSEAATVLRKYRNFAAAAPDELSVWVLMRQAPPLPFLPREVHGENVLVLALCYLGSEESGRKLIAPLADFGKVLGQHVGMQPFTAWQQAFDPLLTPGARNYWKSHNFRELKDGLLDTLVELAGQLPSPQCEIFIGQLGGQVARLAADATAFGNRDATFVMNVHGRWNSPAEDKADIAWAREVYRRTLPFATGGAYSNFLTAEETERVKSAFGANYARLAKVKASYDPGNFFRMNQNILPEGTYTTGQGKSSNLASEIAERNVR
ncbi:MAG: putative oxidoreductase oxygen dependent FAD-dependent protein [Verrucomicrobiales bacterium]|nr:putative oxidoreductase oxygen dependent FAD-dependent protein [Verrucomicrobiales bacterium]